MAPSEEGAVMVTTLPELVALYPAIWQLPLIPLVQSLILLVMRLATVLEVLDELVAPESISRLLTFRLSTEVLEDPPLTVMVAVLIVLTDLHLPVGTFGHLHFAALF